MPNESERWDSLHKQFLEARFELLAYPTKEKLADLIRVAAEADRLNDVLHARRIKFSEGLGGQIESLLAQDKFVWALLLKEQVENPGEHDRLVRISPFQGEIVVTITFEKPTYDGCPTIEKPYGLIRQLIAAVKKSGFRTDEDTKLCLSLNLVEVVLVDSGE